MPYRQRLTPVALTPCALLLLLCVASCSSRRPPSLEQCNRCVQEHAAQPWLSQSPDCRLCFPIRSRPPGETAADQLVLQYGEEYAYVGGRRDKLAHPVESYAPTPAQTATPTPTMGAGPQKPANLVGLALSGGGIRSASFALGALQAMEQTGIYNQLDYMSSVSGGGYLAGWLQAHLGARSFIEKDIDGYQVHASSPADLLANNGDFVEHLRTHSGFLNDGSWLPASKLGFEWLIRWPPHLVMDTALNVRGYDAWYHIMRIYEDRIQATYFRGTPPLKQASLPLADIPLTDINDWRHPDRSPYLILNGYLNNRGASQVGVPEPCDGKWNFEFTRDFVGSDATGYVDARGFGLDVWRVHRDAHGVPAMMVADPDSPDSSSFRLSQAVAASGAAFDYLSVASTFVDYPVAREATELVGGGLLNLSLGLEVENFARRGDADGWDKTRDVAYMETFQRMPTLVTPKASWLYVTDGGFIENLGVESLLRRGVSCVIALDAGADPSRQYDDLRALRHRVEHDLGMRWMTSIPAPGTDERVGYRFVIGDANGIPKAVVLYLKSSADETRFHLQEDRGLRRVQRLNDAEHFNVSLLFDSLRAAVAADPGMQTGQADSLFALEAPLQSAVQSYYDAVGSAVAARVSREHGRDTWRTRRASATNDTSEKSIQLKANLVTLSQPTPVAATPAAEPTSWGEPTPTPTYLDVEKVSQLRQIQLQALQELPTPPADSGPASATPPALAPAAEELRRAIAKVDDSIATTFAGSSVEEAAAQSWQTFESVHQRIEARLDETVFPQNQTEQEWVDQWLKTEADWKDTVQRVNAFSASPPASTFPNDSTLRQTYEWERFEAYRMLGYVTARTYLDPLDPTPSDGPPEWCRLSTTKRPFRVPPPAPAPNAAHAAH